MSLGFSKPIACGVFFFLGGGCLFIGDILKDISYVISI